MNSQNNTFKMKTRSFLDNSSNIASIVKARRNPSDIETTSFLQIGNDPILNNLTTTNSNENFIQNISQNILPEKKVITKTVWSMEDKILFFTALKIYGKNFNEISKFIKSRGSRLNPNNCGKSKEQVRFFYNRTWNNLKQYLKFPSDSSQAVQELYALINYSVFRTRVKKSSLAHFLFTQGNDLCNLCRSTTIKCNGKRITLRTPVCPALKRLNNLKTPEQEYTIPDDVIIELVPRNYVTLWRVQQNEQNPRMRLKVAVNRQLSDVINFLSNKLKSSAHLIRETLTLPPIEPPKLHIRLSDDARFFKEISIQEVSKPRFDSITFKSYCENILKLNSGTPGAPKSSTENETPFFKIDFDDMERKLTSGIGIEDARDMKILALYIGLGCPSVIRFMYEYLYPSDMETAEHSVSNGLRRLLHLSKHDYLENKLNKDTKSHLELQIAELQSKLDALKRQVVDYEEDRYDEMNNSFTVDEFLVPSISPKVQDPNNQNNRPYVYKKQQEALKQLMEDLPNKNNVVINQVEYASDKGNSSLDNIKRFNKNRKRPKSMNNIKMPAVFTLQLPVTIQESHQENMMEANDMSNMYPGMQTVMYPTGTNDLYINNQMPTGNQLFFQNNPTVSEGAFEPQSLSSIINQNQAQNIHVDHCENTNDSLRSFLNEMAESQNADQLNTDSIDYNGLFQNYANDSIMRSMTKMEDLNVSINADSDSGSLSQFLNSCIRSDK